MSIPPWAKPLYDQETLLTTDNKDQIMQAIAEEVSPEQLELRKASERMQVAIDRATELLAASHQHEFMYLLNNNHTALRGCKCGLAFVGLMAGPSPDALQWHQVHEVEE